MKRSTLKRLCKPTQNQKGSVLAIVMLILALLTLLGMSAIDISRTQVNIVSNEVLAQQIFYRTEAATIEATGLLEKDKDGQKLKTGYFHWVTLILKDTETIGLDLTNPMEWKPGNSKLSIETIMPHLDASSRFAAIDRGIAIGESEDMTTSRTIHDIEIYGMYKGKSGVCLLEMGIRKPVSND